MKEFRRGDSWGGYNVSTETARDLDFLTSYTSGHVRHATPLQFYVYDDWPDVGEGKEPAGRRAGNDPSSEGK